MKVSHYVPESDSLKADRLWEENTRWQTTMEAYALSLDRSKDWTLGGVRCGVPEAFSHAYDAAEVAA